MLSFLDTNHDHDAANRATARMARALNIFGASSAASSIRHGGTPIKLSSDVYTHTFHLCGMNGWFRDAKTSTLDNGTVSIRIYKLDGKYDSRPHSQIQRLRAYDSVVSTALVSLVHLYRHSMGGLIDQEARRLLGGAFETTEDQRWKWMFDVPSNIGGDTAEALVFKHAGGNPETSLTTPKTGMAGSSKYLLFRQSEIVRNDGSTVVANNAVSDNACHIYRFKDRLAYDAKQNKRVTSAGGPVAGLLTNLATGPFKKIDFDPTTPYAFGNKFEGRATTTPTEGGDGVHKRVCTYSLVAGVPVIAIDDSPDPYKPTTRQTAYETVSQKRTAPVFDPMPSRQLGFAGVYDGVGRAGSSWFATARFKAFIGTVNRKRKLDQREPEYDMRDVNGYIAGDELNARETIAHMYTLDTMKMDAREIIGLAALCIVGKATPSWYIEDDPLHGMPLSDRLKLLYPPKQIEPASTDDSGPGNTEKPASTDSNFDTFTDDSGSVDTEKPASTDSNFHTFTDDTETWRKLFPSFVPENPGHTPLARHQYYQSIVRRPIRREKVPSAGLRVASLAESKTYDRLGDTVDPTDTRLDHDSYRSYVGCGFSECVVEPLARGSPLAADALSLCVTDVNAIFADTETRFVDNAKSTFADNVGWTDPLYFLVPSSVRSIPQAEITIPENAIIIGATPAAMSCASQIAMQYVNKQLPVTYPSATDDDGADDDVSACFRIVQAHSIFAPKTDKDLARTLQLIAKNSVGDTAGGASGAPDKRDIADSVWSSFAYNDTSTWAIGTVLGAGLLGGAVTMGFGGALVGAAAGVLASPTAVLQGLGTVAQVLHTHPEAIQTCLKAFFAMTNKMKDLEIRLGSNFI